MASTPTTHSRRALALAAVGCALVLAACGSSSKPHAARVQRPCAGGSSSRPACATTAFPASPTRRPARGIQIPVSLAKNPSPAFKSAMQACKYLDRRPKSRRRSCPPAKRPPRSSSRSACASTASPTTPTPPTRTGTRYRRHREPRDKPRLTSVRGRLQNMSIAMKYSRNSVARKGLDPTPPCGLSRPHDPGPVRASYGGVASKCDAQVPHIRGHDQPAGAVIQTASNRGRTATTWPAPDGTANRPELSGWRRPFDRRHLCVAVSPSRAPGPDTRPCFSNARNSDVTVLRRCYSVARTTLQQVREPRKRNVGGSLAAVSCVVALAACGSSHRPSSTTGSRTSSPAIEFADCMRAHGVPSFPDPSEGGGPTNLAGTGTPAFKSASRACARLAPGGTGGVRVDGEPVSRRGEVRQVHAHAWCSGHTRPFARFWPGPGRTEPRTRLVLSSEPEFRPKCPGGSPSGCGMRDHKVGGRSLKPKPVVSASRIVR